jgi:hypothetical protein
VSHEILLALDIIICRSDPLKLREWWQNIPGKTLF